MCVYAGKVHVRGLLRRVWRPRYLALGDDGYLRYHESIPPLFQQDPHHNAHSSNMYSIHHTHRPKTILAILDGARTIDPYCLVDRHVALPQGVYGFVFRGRPVELHTTTDSNNTERGVPAAINKSDAEQSGAVIVPPEGNSSLVVHDHKNNESSTTSSHAKLATKAAVVNLVFPKGTTRRRTAQKIAKKALNPDVLCGFARPNNCGGGSSGSSSSSSLIVGYEQPPVEEESGNDDYDDEGHSNNEWGRDSHESHDTLGSFQTVERSRVSRDLNDSAPHHQSQRKEKMQNAPTKSTIQVQVQSSSIQSREYLCAVSTAEEAESWVVALRWAAEHRRGIRYGNSTKRNEGINSASFASATLPNTAHTSSRSMIGDAQIINPGRDQAVEIISENINDNESHECKSTSNRSSSGTSLENSVGDHSTQKDSGGDSKASLTSLLIEQDGWCKTEKKKKAKDINEESWVTSDTFLNKAPPEPLPLSESNTNADADTQGLLSDESTAQVVSPSSPSHPKKTPSIPGGGGATIVVTKASKFRLPQSTLELSDRKGHGTHKNIPWFPFHFPLPGDDLVLHYEIQLLLLRNCKPRNEISVRPESIEERTICKSMHDVLALVRDLMAEFDTGNHGNLSEEGVEHDQSTPQRKGRPRPTLLPDDTFHLLEDIESNLLACLDLGINTGASSLAAGKPSSPMIPKGTIAEFSSAMSKALASVGIIDSVMRKLSKDRIICSSRHFQEFLCLHSTHRQSSSLSTTSKGRAAPTTVSEEADAEQVVRKWLADIDHPSTMSKVQLILAISLRHKLGGPMLFLMAIWSTSRLASILWFMISGTNIIISVPIETYATLIALSFFFGNNCGLSSRTRNNEYLLETQSRKGHHIPSPTSVDKPKGDKFSEETMSVVDDDHSTVPEEEGSESDDDTFIMESSTLSSPLPLFPANHGTSCWSKPDHNIFMVRGATYLEDRTKTPSAPAVFQCRGVDVWITDNAERNISRHPSVLGGQLHKEDTFIVNFLLPFSNFVAYFTVPPIEEMPANIADVWCKFVKGDQQYRDRKLKLLPVVVDGPWIVKKAVGPGTSPAMVGRDLPLQYYFTEPTATKKGVYEVDVLVTASRIARGILNVVKGHTKSLSIAFAFIIEASEEAQLPETVLCAFQVHSLHLEDCPNLPDCYPDG